MALSTALAIAAFTPGGTLGEYGSPASFWQLMPLCERPFEKLPDFAISLRYAVD